ncbi:hypothetical protein AKO1_005763 [Acrasis kona]|uniref:Uncharacterized protein n=1 Tax=Acrasis kona TaxID=1008807 RepID=A0AAW2YJR6_9EUKA
MLTIDKSSALTRQQKQVMLSPRTNAISSALVGGFRYVLLYHVEICLTLVFFCIISNRPLGN